MHELFGVLLRCSIKGPLCPVAHLQWQHLLTWNSHMGPPPQPSWKFCHSLKPWERKGCKKRNSCNISTGPPGPMERKTERDLGAWVTLQFCHWLAGQPCIAHQLPVLQFPFSLSHCLVDSASLLATTKLWFVSHSNTLCMTALCNMTRTRLW